MTTASTKAAAITVDEYERMIEDGTIGEDDPIELIEGRLVAKMTKKPDHMSSSGRARRAIESVLPSGWHARVEGPVRIPSRDSEPEPDLAVVRGEIDDSRTNTPTLRTSPWSSKSRSRARPKTASSPRPMEAGNPHLLDRQSGSPPTRGLCQAGQRHLLRHYDSQAERACRSDHRWPGGRPDRRGGPAPRR